MIGKKVSFLVNLFPLLLGCSNNGYAGEYVFQMGKSKDTHMGVNLTLSKDYYDVEDISKGQKFILDIDMMSSNDESQTSEEEGEEEDFSFADLLAEMNPLEGYYVVDKQEKIYDEKRLHIGINLLGEFEIPETITDLIFVANINSKEVNFFLPVSLEDLMLQIYWYGYELDIVKIISGESDDPLATPDGNHPVGSHPTKDDIERINKYYKDDHGKPFRDYHVLKLGLTKK